MGRTPINSHKSLWIPVIQKLVIHTNPYRFTDIAVISWLTSPFGLTITLLTWALFKPSLYHSMQNPGWLRTGFPVLGLLESPAYWVVSSPIVTACYSYNPQYIGYNPLFFHQPTSQWIGLREMLQETIDFPIKYGESPIFSSTNQGKSWLHHMAAPVPYGTSGVSVQ